MTKLEDEAKPSPSALYTCLAGAGDPTISSLHREKELRR
jgi:hypothetical protein